MFKHFLIPIIILSIILSYYFITNTLYKLHIHKNIVKYPHTDSDYSFLKNNSEKTTISEIVEKDIFYTPTKWSSKTGNYIHDSENDRYHIIDKDHFYYIPDLTRYSIVNPKNIQVYKLKQSSFNKVIFV